MLKAVPWLWAFRYSSGVTRRSPVALRNGGKDLPPAVPGVLFVSGRIANDQDLAGFGAGFGETPL